MARPELEAQGEGGEELKLLGEAQGPVRATGPVTLPAFETPHAVLAGGVALMVHHKQDVTLHPAMGGWPLVEGTVYVQIVVNVDRDSVLAMPELRVGAVPVDSMSIEDDLLLCPRGRPGQDGQQQELHHTALSERPQHLNHPTGTRFCRSRSGSHFQCVVAAQTLVISLEFRTNVRADQKLD